MTAAKIPEWMSQKLERLARERAARDGCSPAEAINVMTGDAFATLGAELSAFPDCARFLPVSFARNLRAGSFSALSALELAALVIADADAQTASVVAGPNDVVEFTALKIRALADLLRAEGGRDVC